VSTTVSRQEAQLPQRNSASATHMEWVGPTPPPLPLATSMRMVESETRNKRASISTTPLGFEDVPARNSEYLQMVYIAKN